MKYLPVLFGYHASNLGNSHVPLSLCRYWNIEGNEVRLTVPSAEKNLDFPWLIPAMSGIKKKLVYKLSDANQPTTIAEQFFLKHEKNAPYVYLWAGLSFEIFEAFHTRGAKIIIERINCHRQTARNVLQQAADQWNIAVHNPITEEDVVAESRKLDLVDSVFCPSPMVRASMLENRVPETKLLSTSYGWAPERFPQRDQRNTIGKRPIFLFAGTICVRKGIPLLLEAWKRADLDAELVLCGNIAPEISHHFPSFDTYKNVRHVAYTRDIGQLYSTADLFVFPSLEEGGPMVTYEAMAHAIPPLVTAMGGGAIVQDGLNGIILPDMDIDAWAEAMTAMVQDPAKRAELGENARKRAEMFTWKNVAKQRGVLLQQRYTDLWK
ncbi:MAG: glycosyl transferase family 1 [Prosthecochloris sp.]|uniref:glycosyltransferase family 4 protein n=1 Tax=Prosthecochloris sp. TaxID=290513 RepID=UPI0013C9825C|nr:glycosyltransferase family 4 protein [Prosthecochloris sp.]NEX13032.1 glycosyl transferase family 1 [Prosthecochloris sp.]